MGKTAAALERWSTAVYLLRRSSPAFLIYVFEYATVHCPQDGPSIFASSASGQLVNDPAYKCSDCPINKVNDSRALPVFMLDGISQVTQVSGVKLDHPITAKPSPMTSVTKGKSATCRFLLLWARRQQC